MVRRIERIFYTPHFQRSYKNLPLAEKNCAKDREAMIRANIFDPRLNTHKLSGKLKGLWACSVAHSHRILFEFLDDHTVLFHDIGDHQVYG